MLSCYLVTCPHEDCGWTGRCLPSFGEGPQAEIASMQRAWLRCPRCRRDWEVRISNRRVMVLPVVEHGG